MSEVSSSSEDPKDSKRQQFGNRLLEDGDDVFRHNAWDNVEWDEEQQKHAENAVATNGKLTLTADQVKMYENDADKYWDKFYEIHNNRFFKDRHWLFTEFPELDGSSSEPNNDNIEKRIFEIGCGVGNTIIPILTYNRNDSLKVFGCDFSEKAINILKEHSDYDTKRCEAFVLDAIADEWSVPFDESSIDIIVLIFVLSAIHPNKMQHVINQCYKYLKPGGQILLRDYGRYDMAQLRFKPGKCLQDNFYVRGDGTRVYFFTQDELKKLFENCGFVEQQMLTDRRLQVNRGKLLKMYRVWIQTKFQKPLR